MSNPEATVLYDEDCGFCKWSLDKILAWDRSHHLQPMPIQSEEGQRLLADVPVAQRLDSWHLVDEAGSVRSAGAGFGILFDILPGGAPLAAGARAFPRATERAYRAVAGNRTRLAKLLRIEESCEVRRGSGT
ncbi:MAG: DCC1-like thiol-disulfide oxidoreductase family protein [Actinomycetota bacterium]|nr:DCC1-like thiol-disulfide oxidoreductase family protein [Actinomycetota bacterium]